MFKLTSLTLETGISGPDASIEFKVISTKEFKRIEGLVNSSKTESKPSSEMNNDETDPIIERNPNLVLHFSPTKRDIIKASFTSFSFLLLVSIIFFIYSKITNFDGVVEKAGGFFSKILDSSFIVFAIIITFLIASIILGFVRTYLKYGKYDIASDDERIYITKGILNESSFSIMKEKVQAIEITQSVSKRLLRLAEIKLISAGSIGDEDLGTNSLYPFLPVKRAYELVDEILPAYEVADKMVRLPKKSFWIRMLKPSWFWIISTVALFYFKPLILDTEQAWWILSVGLFFFIIGSRLLDYFNTRYIINGKFIQFKTGSLQTSVFISKRDKIVEINVSRSKIQQLLGLASIGTINRAKPIHHASVDDIPVEMADSFYTWYAGRLDDVETE